MPSEAPYLDPVNGFAPYIVETASKLCVTTAGFVPLKNVSDLATSDDVDEAREEAAKFGSVEEALEFVGVVRKAETPHPFGFFYRIVDADGDVAWSDQGEALTPAEPEPELPGSYRVGSRYNGGRSSAIVAPSVADFPVVDLALGRPIDKNAAKNVHPDVLSLESGVGICADSSNLIFRLGRGQARELADALYDAADEAEELANV